MLYEKDRYISPLYEWLVSAAICEYDLEKANISILLEEGLISQDEYRYYASVPKARREVMVGCLQRDNPIILDGLKRGFVNARRKFFEANNIPDENVLYIDKDSITVINFNVGTTRPTQNLNFRLKNKYSSFYRIFLVDFLYFNDNNDEYYRIKGATKEMLNNSKSFENGILDFISEIAYCGQFNPEADILRMIKSAYRKYTAMELNLDFYREFNHSAKFKIKSDSDNFDYYVDHVESLNPKQIDISYNASIFRLFYKIFAKQFFSYIL